MHAERAMGLHDAYEACERQVQLASLVAAAERGQSPSDFQKGVLSCMAAINALQRAG